MSKDYNGVPIEELLNVLPMDENNVERVSFRKIKASLDIVEPDPTWPASYEIFAKRIISVLGLPSSDSKTMLALSHVGSTSVPDLPAKAIIDIDIIVPDPNNEAAYVPALESQGFQFMLREPKWYDHRFFTIAEPMFANVHVWGPRNAAAERHNVFKEWLLEHKEDRDLYAKVKREASAVSQKAGENTMAYSDRKDYVVREIEKRAYRSLGFID